MATKIRVLPDQAINQIAAGEVVENSASVVKELVENALDAGATDIHVEVKAGGRHLIRVVDNGCGMVPDDALLCLERHATSKIRSADDLNQLSTMGFRGEALPSIAAVSKFTLLTAPAKGEATIVVIEGGRIMHSGASSRSQGTTIEVKSLFFNVPVRKKFLRSVAYDTAEVDKMMSQLALANPKVKFQLVSDQKILLNATSAAAFSDEEGLAVRIADVLGSDFFSSLAPVSFSQEPFQISGFIGSPTCTRSNRTGQSIFINRRPVICPLVSVAVNDGYGSCLQSQRFPVFVLHITIPGDWVDVNVHPQKREVRLREELLFKQLVARAVEKALQRSGAHSLISSSSADEAEQDLPIEETSSVRAPFVIPEAFAHLVMEPAEKVPYMRGRDFSFSARSESRAEQREFSKLPEADLFSASSKNACLPRVLGVSGVHIIAEASGLETSGGVSGFQKGREGWVFIDVRAAGARVLFEQLIRQSKALTLETETMQTLLLPITLEFSTAETLLVMSSLEELNRMGLGIRSLGKSSFIVDALTPLLDGVDVASLIREIIQELRHAKGGQLITKEKERLIAVQACRQAVLRGDKYSRERAQALVEALLECQSPFQCPQGMPTMIFVSQSEIFKRFES